MKKKKYVYFVVPVLGILIFAAIYWNYVSSHDAKIAERAATVKRLKQEAVDKENADKKKAYDEAMATQAKRTAEKKAKEAHDQKEKDDLDAANQALSKAGNESERLSKQLERLRVEVKNTKDEIVKIKEAERQSIAEEAFLKTFVVKDQENVKQLSAVIEKIDAANEAAAKAEAAARAAEKKKNS
jgi:chromosome segregation ATPase